MGTTIVVTIERRPALSDSLMGGPPLSAPRSIRYNVDSTALIVSH